MLPEVGNRRVCLISRQNTFSPSLPPAEILPLQLNQFCFRLESLWEGLMLAAVSVVILVLGGKNVGGRAQENFDYGEKLTGGGKM